MLNDANYQPSRICVICDGIEALLRMSAYLLNLPNDIERRDLGLHQALAELQSGDRHEWDQVILAVDLSDAVLPKLVLSVLEAASLCCETVILLLSPRQNFARPDIANLRILHGPPFNLAEAQSSEASKPANKAGILAKLLRKPSIPSAVTAKEGQVDSKLPRSLGVIMVQGLAGGIGTTTFAVALADVFSRAGLRVRLLDLNLQFGNAAGYFGLKNSDHIVDIYRNLAPIDAEAFTASLISPQENLHILSSPSEILPSDALQVEQVEQLVELAERAADLVIVELPSVITESVGFLLKRADLVFLLAGLDVRSADNARKWQNLFLSESIDMANVCHILSGMPLRPDDALQQEIKAFEAGLGQEFYRKLPFAADEVRQAANAGLTITRFAPSHALSREITALCAVLMPLTHQRKDLEADLAGDEYV